MFDRSLDVNGFEVRARYTRRTVAEVLEPLCGLMSGLHARAGRPLVVLMAAPPGAGKSTLAQALAMLSRPTRTAAVGMDGFHYPAAYLAAHRDGAGRPLASIKGAPETYDLPRLRAALGQLLTGRADWPVYDRRLHDVAAESLRLCADVFIVEGNWLLLDEPGWRELRAGAALSISLTADEELLLPRLIARKVRGGMDEAAARAFCLRSDLDNIRRQRARLLPADVALRVSEAEGGIELAPVGPMPSIGGFTIC